LLKSSGLVCAGDGFVVPSSYDAAILDTRWSFAGTWDFQYASSGYIFGARASASGSTATYTTVEPCTAIEIHWFNDIGNPATVLIDGVAPVHDSTITPIGGSNTIGSAVYSGLANTTHTVEITTGASFALHGVDCYSAAGFVVDNFGYSGSSTKEWITTDWKSPQTLAARASGRNPNGFNIAIVGLGTNDAIHNPNTDNGTAPTTFEANLLGIVQSLSGSLEVMLISQPPSANYYDTTNGATLYVNAAYDIARSQNVRVLDMFDRWVDYNEAGYFGLISSDGVHPGDTGYRDYAKAVASLIGVRS
jgi:lysophospholipase L1-like esterase